METMGGLLMFVILIGVMMRMLGSRERARRLGPGTPARFLDFTGQRRIFAKPQLVNQREH